jgi:hypothetical protein
MSDKESLCEARSWFVCPSCDGACHELREGVCPGCHYTMRGGDLAPDEALLNPAWSARMLTDAALTATNWWCR